MADNFLFSLNVVLPLFLCCVVGYAAHRFHLVGEAFISECSHVVFYIAIPANVFLSISGSSLDESLSLPLMGFVFAAILITGALLCLIVPRLVHNRPVAATVTVTMFRSNFAMLGIPLAISLMGEAGAAPTLVMVPFATLLYTILSVAILALMTSGEAGNLKSAVCSAGKEVIRNPLIIASVASILVALLHLPLPTFVDSTIELFADMCTGLSLFMLGAQLNMKEAKGRLRYTVPVVIVRLILIPLLVVGCAALLGFCGGELACVFIFFSAPTAVNSYILAGRMGGDGKLAGDAVLATSCVSSITLTIGIFILKSLQLF